MDDLEEKRQTALTHVLLSPAVSTPATLQLEHEEDYLSDKEVAKIFIDNVPGVRGLLFREQEGMFCLKFMVQTYRVGIRAFRDTEVHQHLILCMRHVVHRAREAHPDARKYLLDIAEAFTGCQALQARAIERAALSLSGSAVDFRMLVTRFVGEYKALAVRMLAYEWVADGKVHDRDQVPVHYENRLTADVGESIGANADEIRRARLDFHANSRFPKLDPDEISEARARCMELFDLPAMIQALVCEVNSSGDADASNETISTMFFRWVDENMSNKHVVLDNDTHSRPDINYHFARSLLEKLYMGSPQASDDELFKETPMNGLFCNVAANEQEQRGLECQPEEEMCVETPSGLVQPRLTLLTESVLTIFRILTSLFHGVSRSFWNAVRSK